QYCEGLRDPLIVYDSHDPYSNMYDMVEKLTFHRYHVNPFDVTPTTTSDSLLIDGIGRHFGGPNSTLAVINVVQEKWYRIRLLNTGCKPCATYVYRNSPSSEQ
ncbi:hypothetical protein F5J12DRAFT_727039, partial [Pisolithus orientalis]|uniref:uncharacterized protein n=1 Tax=Pisolithus orientalis TaxID=936130 RepID=UPI002224E6BB